MCGAMWNVEHSLAVVSLYMYKLTQNEQETQSLVEKTGLRLKMKFKIKANQVQNQ